MIKPNKEGKFFCECGSELNVPEQIPHPPIPEELKEDRIELNMANIRCPNPSCGKSYIYLKDTNLLTE